MRLAMAQPCLGSRERVFRIRTSRAPWMRLLGLLMRKPWLSTVVDNLQYGAGGLGQRPVHVPGEFARFIHLGRAGGNLVVGEGADRLTERFMLLRQGECGKVEAHSPMVGGSGATARPGPQPSARLCRRATPFTIASSRSLSWKPVISSRSAASLTPRIRTASRPALRAPATPTVATGTPAGI